MMKEIELLTKKELREKVIGRTEILNKVGILLLSNDEFGTMQQVADYYKVGIEAINSLVKDNRDEVISDGYKVLTDEELKSFKNLCQIKSRARQIAVFPKRAILRVGMLLRDSEVAKEIRTQLLNTIENTSDDIKVKEIDEEKKLLFNIAMADTPEEQMIAVSNYRKYMDRYKDKANKWEQFISQEGCHTFTEAAKMISTHAKEENIPIHITVSKLTSLLRDKGILSKNKSHKSYLNLPNSQYEKYFNTTSIDINSNGKEFKKSVTKVKGNGLEFIYDILKKEYIK